MTDITRDIALTNAWQKISVDGETECSVTLEGNRSFQAVVRVDTVAPAANVDTGHRLTQLQPSVPIYNIKPGHKVWARAVNGTATLCVS